MLAKVTHLMQWIEDRAPRRLAEEWDNPGLMWGHPLAEVRQALVAVDGTDAVLQEAAEKGADLVVLHHPTLWKGVKHLRTDRALGRRVEYCLRHGIAVYAAHTNYDAAPDGVSDALANRFGLLDLRVLEPTQRDRLQKLVVFVPQGYEDAVHRAMSAAGAGWIGKYSHCSFQVPGTGTFMPREGADPFIGKVGELERTPEVRVETVVPLSLSRRVVAAMLRAHPYEEVAYDLIPLDNAGPEAGAGRVGRLPAALTLADFAETVKEACRAPALRLVGDPERRVQRVAVCGGDGHDLLAAAARAGADVLVTGDIGHHDALEAMDLGLAVLDAGHYATERPAMEDLANWLNQRLEDEGYETRCAVASSGRDPFRFV